MTEGFSITIAKGQGITQALLEWAKKNEFDLTDDKITSKEWINTVEVLKKMHKGRGADGLSVFANDVLTFTAKEQADIMEAMGLKISSRAPSSEGSEPVVKMPEVPQPEIRQPQPSETYKPFDEIVAGYEKINSLPSDKEKVIEYHKMNADKNPENYVIVDKDNASLQIYSAEGELLKTFDAGLGAQKGDAYLTEDRRMTSAGIYEIKYKGSGHDDYAPNYKDNIYEMTTERGETGVAIHQIPLGAQWRYGRHYNGTADDNRYSNGCINLTEKDFNTLEKYISGKGTKVYVLPEEENNYLTVKNGKLSLTQKEYDGQVKTSLKSDEFKPIKFNLSKDHNRNAHVYAGTLEDKKLELMERLNLSNDEYNMLAELAFGLAERESEFGSGFKYWVKESANWLVSFAKKIQNDNSFNSRGLTQMKLQAYTDKETVELLHEYGIKEDNLKDPSKSAIATMIVLRGMYKNELPNLRSKMAALNVSDTEALVYLWTGKRGEITLGTATPSKNNYIAALQNFKDSYSLLQKA